MTPEQMALLGLLCGACAGLGAWGLLAVAWESGRGSNHRATDLMTRVALSLRDVSPAARDFLAPRSSDPVSVLGVVIQPGVLRVSRKLSQWLGESESATTQLARSGWDMSLEQYRLVRLASSAAGAAAGLVVFTVVTNQQVRIAMAGLGVLLGAILGAAVFDRVVRRAVLARTERLIDEFPSVIELLAVALSAGESLPGALLRIAERGSGELASEFRRVMRRVEVGESLGGVLRDSARVIGVPEIEALLEHLVSALERGAPLSEVVRSHSADSRAERLRAIVDRAGKAEVRMLVPLVLLILPTTVVFAVWPSLQALQAGL